MSNGIEPLRLVSRSVLIADDDRNMRQMLATHFRRAGFEVREVADGLQLIDSVHRWIRQGRQPHVVIITDVEMPGLNGLDALARIHRALPKTPVIVVTGFGDASLHERARRLGAAAVFSKPVDLKLLRDTATLLAAV